MPALTDLPELIGFFSYSREDDEDFGNTLSRLRTRIQTELRAQLGRSKKTLRLWQDKEAISPGTLWAPEIQAAVDQSVFFIPIVSPRAVQSSNCQIEFQKFLDRERELGRNDLVFPILFIDVPELKDKKIHHDTPLVKAIAERQCVDWRDLRYDPDNPKVWREIGVFCEKIAGALRRIPLEAKRAAISQGQEKPGHAEQEQQAEDKQPDKARKMMERGQGGNKRDGQSVWRPGVEPQSGLRRPQLIAGALATGIAIIVAVWIAPPRQSPIPPPAKIEPSAAPRIAANGPLSLERERALKAKDTFKECADCPEMVVIPSGTFIMGSPESEPGREHWQKGTESPQLRVTIERTFAVAKFAVTRAEFEAFAKETTYHGSDACYTFTWTTAEFELVRPKSFLDPGFVQGDRDPVVCVNWIAAKQYVDWLKKNTHKEYRLLSEAEREYATRAGSTTPFWWGSSVRHDQANYKADSVYEGGGGRGEFRQRTVPVDSFAPNPWELYNVHGNVNEWTEDCWNVSLAGNPGNGRARSGNCNSRAVRGGSWVNLPLDIRSATRAEVRIETQGDMLGFRVARDLSP